MTKGPAATAAVCLTFDDGPHPEWTPRLLDVLKARDVRATFFLVGRNAEMHPGIVRRMVDEGHAVGNHTYSHVNAGLVPARSLMDEVRRTDVFLAGLLGRAPGLFRPPHGKLTAPALWRLWRGGQAVVLWNVDPRDYRGGTAEEIGSWFREHPLRGGDLVLMHDPIPQAAEVLPPLIDEARGRGLTFATPSEWFA
jgi:peptidoglycan/xylan/chitin deacetylase (PgdA/CDA1 family)